MNDKIFKEDFIKNIEWISVKTGDILENGPVVESTYTMPVYNYPFENDSIVFEGAEFYFGSLEEAGYDFGSDVPAFSKARLIIKNIRSQYDGYNGDIPECTILDQ